MTAELRALLPCPWCGGEAVLSNDGDPNYPISIVDSHVEPCPLGFHTLQISYPTEAEAVKAWNQRNNASALLDEIEVLRAALEPVLHWYQSDEHDDRPLVDIVTDIVEDLQHDRALALQVQRLHLAGANLSICAQTTGGVAGPDAGLMLAIEQWAEADAPVRQALSQSPTKGNAS